ncbi:sodium-independent sulfate anion transporter [Condylostylus longicornis]|uniref:sodium-independent sulfate anion transporter n=1 Tax=Condylostylus longicornis TaxID=2530218 RepID=UPI00244DA396|nr:sodium-independent sulfate anion transporter [Condylostylus longicornis]
MRHTRNHRHSRTEISIEVPAQCQFKGSNAFEVTKDLDNEKMTALDHLKLFKKFTEDKAKNIFRKKMLYKRLPILTWLPKYTKEDAIGDLVAGFTVGLTVIPQALAYSGIAGLPPNYGLYGSFLGCFIYIFLGSSKDVPMGPTAIASLLTFQTAKGVWQRAVLLSFLTGIIELLMGLFNLGFLIDFVSGPVSSGFTSAVSLIILTSQVKDILGVRSSGTTFVQAWISIIEDIHNIRLWDTALGLACIAILLLMRQMVNLKLGDEKKQNLFVKILNKFVWLLATARNAVLVITFGAIGAYLYSIGDRSLKMIGYVPAGLPTFQLPPFSIPGDVISRNQTEGEHAELKGESFTEMVSNMGSGLIVVPLIALLENIATCKAFSHGKPVDATQELIAIGTANIANSFAQGYPGSGALARGAVNNASGVRTQLGNLYTGTIVILALLYLTPYFYYIPKATLAAIIIAAVIFTVEYRVIKPMWRSKRTDLIPGLSTFIACLVLPLELGILVGIGINVVFILYHAARPKLRLEFMVTDNGHKYLVLTPDRCIIFPSVEFVRNEINKQGLKSTLPVVIDCSHIYGADFTAAKVISTLVDDFGSRKQKIFFYNLKPHVSSVFEGAKIDLKIFYNFDELENAIAEMPEDSDSLEKVSIPDRISEENEFEDNKSNKSDKPKQVLNLPKFPSTGEISEIKNSPRNSPGVHRSANIDKVISSNVQPSSANNSQPSSPKSELNRKIRELYKKIDPEAPTNSSNLNNDTK